MGIVNGVLSAKESWRDASNFGGGVDRNLGQEDKGWCRYVLSEMVNVDGGDWKWHDVDQERVI